MVATLILNMETLTILLIIVLIISGIMMLLTSFGLFTDKNKNNIPDYLDKKFEDLKEEINKLKK
tara:strand:+ start:706 stop:897 length:192 start_codon:yes stop_codon:yes gene_type:complete